VNYAEHVLIVIGLIVALFALAAHLGRRHDREAVHELDGLPPLVNRRPVHDLDGVAPSVDVGE